MTVPLIILAVFPPRLGGFIGHRCFRRQKCFRLRTWLTNLPWYEILLESLLQTVRAQPARRDVRPARCHRRCEPRSNVLLEGNPKTRFAINKLGWFGPRQCANRFYFRRTLFVDDLHHTPKRLSKFADWFDRWIIAGLGVRGTHGTTEIFGRAPAPWCRRGNLQTYAFFFRPRAWQWFCSSC